MKISFELTDAELDHYRLLMKQVQIAAGRRPREQIIGDAEKHLAHARRGPLPAFAVQRFDAIMLMIEMLRDDEWDLAADEAQRLLNVLAYFSEPDDLIPDDMPALGFIDDAIMIELVLRDLQPELDAYRNYKSNRGKSDDPNN